MKRFSLVLIAFILILNTTSFADNNHLDLDGEGVLLADYNSGRIIYEKNIHKKLYPASTTKIMTAILAIEYGNMDDIVTIDEEIINLTEGSHIALDYDEEILFEDLLNAMLIASANDAAVALGKHISGSIDGFVNLMNDKAKELGASNTHFTNPSGLHDDDHYSTAYDLYLISRYAMENELFREIVNKDQYEIDITNKKGEVRLLHNTNRFLYGNEKMNIDGKTIPIKYEGVSGIKTGTTGEAKNCLVSFASRDAKTLISVVLKANGKEVYADTYKLLDHGFKNFNNVILAHSNEFIENIDIKNGSVPFVPTILDKDIYYILGNGELDEIERKININKDLVPPISEGDVLGNVEYYIGDELVGKGNIVSTLSVSFIPSVAIFKTILSKWYILIPILIILFRIFQIRRRARRRRKSKSFYSYTSAK